ncbi:MAG: HEAT repeat domain-containing protein [Proteobacteria bacterium]|nr:HEAT repeat domain-containing protein [Pseudomonadota bacterium]
MSYPVSLACVGLAALALASAPDAQGQSYGHGLPPPPRSLLERMAEADAVALAVVETVELGRVRLRDAQPLVGEVAVTFEIKRAPAKPPELAPGDSALLLLRGARSPYVLVDRSSEIIRLEGPEEWPTWRSAVRALLGSAGRADALLAIYETWIDGPSEGLRQEALRGLRDPSSPFQPLPATFAEGRVAVATDPSVDTARRSASAFAAGLSPSGAPLLLARMPGDAESALAEVLSVALVRAPRSPDARDAVLRSLHHESPEIRRTALPHTSGFADDPEVVAALDRIASADPDDEARALAERILRRVRREGRRR